jgi:hypothetical protein
MLRVVGSDTRSRCPMLPPASVKRQAVAGSTLPGVRESVHGSSALASRPLYVML